MASTSQNEQALKEPSLPGKAVVRSLAGVVAADQLSDDQFLADARMVDSMRGSWGERNSMSGIMQVAASIAPEPNIGVKALAVVPAVLHHARVNAIALRRQASPSVGKERLRARRTPRSSATQHCSLE